MSSTYSRDDFKYSLLGGYSYTEKALDGSVIHKGRPVWVHYAYGNIDSEGTCCAECGGEWSGGFVISTAEGKIAHITGWCDYTGWGCRDGADFTLHDSLDEIKVGKGWDKDPADLNQALDEILKEIAKEEA